MRETSYQVDAGVTMMNETFGFPALMENHRTTYRIVIIIYLL